MARSLTEWTHLEYTVTTDPDNRTLTITQDGDAVTVMLADLLAIQDEYPPSDDIPPGHSLWDTTARGIAYRLSAKRALDENDNHQTRIQIRDDDTGEKVAVLLTDLPDLADQCPNPRKTAATQTDTADTAEAH